MDSSFDCPRKCWETAERMVAQRKDDLVPLPGRYTACEIGQVVAPGSVFRIEEDNSFTPGPQLYVVYTAVCDN